MVYLPLAIIITFIVAKIFFKNSRIFMSDIFRGRLEIANSTNTLFEMGFYLLSLGFALSIMEIGRTSINNQQFYEILSQKVGVLSVFLGAMVFFNLYMLFRGKKKSSDSQRLRERFQNQKAIKEGITIQPKG
ncbi:MAG: hypothetical protein ACI9JN_002891 [Bacteroidia bacterium]